MVAQSTSSIPPHLQTSFIEGKISPPLLCAPCQTMKPNTSEYGHIRILNKDGSLGDTVVAKGKTIIGRDQNGDTCISSPLLSLQHTKIFVDENNNYTMENLSETQSTLVNGSYHPYAVTLKDGDLLSVGDSRLLFQSDGYVGAGKIENQKKYLTAAIGCGQPLQEIPENLNYPRTVRRKLSLRSDDRIHLQSGPGSSAYSNRGMPAVGQLRISIPCDSQQSIESTKHGRPVLQTPIDTPYSINHMEAQVALSCSPVKKAFRESSKSFKAPSFHSTPYCDPSIDQGSAQISPQKFIPARASSSFKAPPLNLLQPVEIDALFDRKSLDIFGDSTSPFKLISVKSQLEPPGCNVPIMNQAASFSSIQNLLSGYSSYKRLCLVRDCCPQSARKSESKDKDKDKDIFDRLSYSYGRDFSTRAFPPYELGSVLLAENTPQEGPANLMCGTTGVSTAARDDDTCSDLSQDQTDAFLGNETGASIEFRMGVDKKKTDKARSKKRSIEVVHQFVSKQPTGRRSARFRQAYGSI